MKFKPSGTVKTKALNNPDSFMTQDQIDFRSDKQAAGMGTAVNWSFASANSASQSLISGSSLNVETSNFAERDGYNVMDSQYENSLSSSSLSELSSKKLRVASETELYGHSVDTISSHTQDQKLFESQEIEEKSLGDLLPDDDDLLSGVADRLDFAVWNAVNDMEELDYFSNVGGMDLEDGTSSVENPTSNKSISCRHPWNEHPSRTLLVRNVNSKIEDSELRALFQTYGDICTLKTSCKNYGSVTISYYDIRAAQNAMESLQNRPPRGWKLDVQYSLPEGNSLEEGINQGLLLVSNLDSSVSNEEFHRIFGTCGNIKEIRNSHHGTQQKFVEFYDRRAAKEALHILDGTNIAGKQIKVEPSYLGGMNRLAQGQGKPPLQGNIPTIYSHSGFHGSVPLEPVSVNMVNGASFGKQSVVLSQVMGHAFDHGISSSVPNSSPSLLQESVGIPSCHADFGLSLSHVKSDLSPNFHPLSLPDYQGCLVSGISCISISNKGVSINEEPVEINSRRLSRVGTNGTSPKLDGGVFASACSSRNPVPANHCIWEKSYHPQHPAIIWPTPPPTVDGISFANPRARLYKLPVLPSHLLNNIVPRAYHNVGSSPDASGFHPGSLSSITPSKDPPHSVDLLPYNPVPYVNQNCMALPMSPKLVGLHFQNQKCVMFPGSGQMVSVLSSFDPPNDCNRTHRTKGASSLTDNRKQYELNTGSIIRGEDKRTTLMLKNIPNKYTSKMLVAAIDEQHRGTYDFIYLPIDFKNKCNVGYAFINMVDASQIIPFYKAFNGKRWEKFNSEKVASLAYARIQGKAALIAHFQNSSLMNEDKRCRPILFNTEGPNAGDQVPFPVRANVRSRKTRSNTPEKIHQGSSSRIDTGDNPNGDLLMISGKDLV